MNKISCDICMDLIPLVNDQVASQESGKAVLAHIKDCESCRGFSETGQMDKEEMNDNRLLLKIRKQLYLAGVIAIIIGAILGTALTDGIGLFYNILIMPIIGVIGYLLLRKKSYYVPLILFAFIYVWLFIKYLVEGIAFSGAMIMPFYWAFIYTGLCALGLVIGFLLKIAFGKEGKL